MLPCSSSGRCRLRWRLSVFVRAGISFERRRLHFASYRHSYAWNTGQRRDRCSVIARLKFLAVCLRRDCSASREFMEEGQPAPARTAVYNYICPESGAGASPLREDCFSCDEKGERWNVAASRIPRVSPARVEENNYAQSASRCWIKWNDSVTR